MKEVIKRQYYSTLDATIAYNASRHSHSRLLDIPGEPVPKDLYQKGTLQINGEFPTKTLSILLL